MPIYMDVHNVPGIKARDVAEAHRKDILLQEEHGCKCITYWLDEERENVFCLIEAPGENAVNELHNRAHGLIPNKIIEVSSAVVESFLGRIYDPPKAETTDDGLKIFSDSSFRTLLVTKVTDPILLRYKLGLETANELLNRHNEVIRKNLIQYGGREVEHGGAGFVSSFVSAARAVSCAFAIQKDLSDMDVNATGFRIAINAGEPVSTSSQIFGDTVLFAEHMCTIAKKSQIAVASAVKDLVSKDHFQDWGKTLLTLSPQDELLLELLLSKLEENWQNPDFNVSDYARAMTMSRSQLYRKTIEISGLSPNLLLKDFRLEKAKEMMKKQRYNISQITFDSGFTSPSYFTKCFKRKYGLLPLTYIDLLH